MTSLLVTGAAGFIGSNYVRWVLGHTDDRIRIYDALTYAGNPVTVAELQALGGDRVEFVTPTSATRRRRSTRSRSPRTCGRRAG